MNFLEIEMSGRDKQTFRHE